MTTEIILIFSFILFIFLSILSYFILKKLKGDLDIIITKTDFFEDDLISGKIKLKAKKPIQSNKLYIKLIREELITQSKNSHWKAVFSSLTEIENQRDYNRNFTNYYDFEIKIPNSNKDENFYSRGHKFLSFKKQIRWKLKVVLDATGIDLDKEKIITVRSKINNQD